MPRMSRARVLAALSVAALALSAPVSNAAKPPKPVPIKHVYVYVMENTSFNDVIDNKDAPYLNGLAKRYALLTNYTATGHASLDNYISMTSGQLPNPGTSGDCFFYGTPLCIQDVPNIADQLEAKRLTWKGYFDAMPQPCAHTAENTVEQSQTGYSPRHNPFVYYRSIMGNDARCKAHVRPLTDLWRDQKAGRVPNYSFVVPDTCHDGHDSGAACEQGGGVKEADWFAARTIPRLMADKSFKDSLIILTFDEGGVADDDEPLSVDAGGGVDFGGRIFTLLVSPNVSRGTLTGQYNHYSMLKTVEDVFCLDYLGQAKDTSVRSFIDALHQKRCAK